MFRYLALIFTVFLANPAVADGPSYTYLNASYQSVDLDPDVGIDVDGNGYGLYGSFEIGDSMFGFAGYVKTNFDFGVDQTQLQAGLGYHAGLTDNTDFYASLAYVDAEVGASGFGSADDSGYGATIGVRSIVSDLIEFYGEVVYLDFGDGDNTSLGAGIWFNLTDSFALGLGAARDDDATAYGAGARLYFGS